jgi:DNA-binding LytR/AlgR family response regulator
MSAGTTGSARVTSGWPWDQPNRASTLTTLGLLGLGCAVNVSTRLHDTAGRMAPWRPVVWEVSSSIAVFAALWIVFGAVDCAARLGLSWRRALPLHAAAACAFSAQHCLGMWTLRRIAYTIAGASYGWTVSPGQVLYEFRKDVLTYVVIALIRQALRHARPPAPAAAPAVAPAPARFDIKDGARLHRVKTADILAIASAGNYVEILVEDGRRIMMRATLSGLLGEPALAGFLRVHRSWIVNPAAVRAITPEGSNDFSLTLAGGAAIPLSRRYPEALAQLRGAAKQAVLS